MYDITFVKVTLRQDKPQIPYFKYRVGQPTKPLDTVIYNNNRDVEDRFAWGTITVFFI